MKKALPAIVTLAVMATAWLMTRPPSWVQPLYNALGQKSFLVVVDEDTGLDPNHLQGLVWVSRNRLKRSHLKDLDQVFWLRARGSEREALFGLRPKDCKEQGPVALCLVSLDTWHPWRFSQRGRELTVKTRSKSCRASNLRKKCFYGQENWEYLRRESHRFDGEARACLWTHPVADDLVTITIPNLAAGNYRLVAGIDDSGVGGGRLGAVDLTITARGEPAWTQQLRIPDHKGLQQRELPFLKKGQKLELQIGAEKTGARFFCWDLERSAALRRPSGEVKEPRPKQLPNEKQP